MPLMNIILEKATKRQLQLYIGIILFFFCGIQTLFFSDAFGTDDGYSAIWLMILYLAGGYLRKYGSLKSAKPVRYLLGYFAFTFLTWLSKLLIELLTLHFLGEPRAGNYFMSYKSPTVFLAAVCLVLFFANLKIPPFWKKIIGFLSPMTFGVYLIHSHPLVLTNIMEKSFVGYAALPCIAVIPAVLGTAAGIYFVCSGIDFIRLRLFKMLRVRQRLDAFEQRIKTRLSE